MDPADIAPAQEYCAQLDDAALAADPLLSHFKEQEVSASLAAASTGKYYDFWTVERIADLNNVVDRSSNCPDSLKSIFAPGSSKLPRIRGNKIGQLVSDRVVELMKSGGPRGGSGNGGGGPAPILAHESSNTGALPGPESSQPSSDPATEPAPPKAADRPTSRPPGPPERYEFAPDLPQDCQLRVRSRPSKDADTLGVVTRDDDIYAVDQVGDWIRVELPGSGLQGEAWMMINMEGKELLIKAGSAAALRMDNTAPNSYAPIDHGGPSIMDQSATITSTYAQPVQQSPLVSLSPARPPSASVHASQMGASFSGSMSHSVTVPPLDAGGVAPSTVSYAAYQMLEMRVSRLEQELSALVSKLRNI